ncbi:MAG: response regulator transcription factor [Lachnospiraceae bacterium]|nr:response regulator transcription factor [Lachnospiraceae bacterium]
MENLRVLLVDDEPLLLESLEIILSFHGMEIIGTAPDGNAALRILEKEGCDLALVDLNMKGMGGLELIGRMKSEYPNIKILVLTTFYDDKNITKAIAGGADGYLLKDSGKDAILGAIGQIMGGQNVIDARVMQRLAVLVNGRGQTALDTGTPDFLADMTRREKEICTLLSRGLTNRQISETLFISEGTVKNYISSIYDKTGIHDRAKLVVAMKGDGL